MINQANAHRPQILIVDDEEVIRNILCDLLNEDYQCITADSAEKALALLKTEKFNLVLSDINLGGLNGIDLIPQILALSPDTVVMMISGGQSIESAIRAMRVGAFDYIQKPFDLRQVETAVERALGHQFLLESKRVYENHLEQLVKQRTAQLDYLSFHDTLTGLPNRILLEDRLTQAIAFAAQNNHSSALFFIALDNFEKINDTLGDASGYQLLQKVAEKLLACVPAGATVARFEGSKFSILLPQIGLPDEAIDVAADINEISKLPFSVEGKEFFITLSVGISIFPNDGENAQTLFKKTGIALQQAKESGGDNYSFYTKGLNSQALYRLNLENDLRKALERNEFEVFYQPKINFDTGKICGMEALVRWNHPQIGLVSPLEFVPLAEATGLIIPLGEWILQTACCQTKQLADEGFASLRVSVNVSALQFKKQDLAQTILKIVRQTEIDPHNLELELTESAVMENPESAVEILRELKEIGIKISIDDFGTGYSSLAYLKRLPIDILKIDKSFILEIADGSDETALVKTIIALARSLHLKVIAEGIETVYQQKLLQILGCDEWQGFLCSQPIPFQQFKQKLVEPLPH